MRIFNLCIYKKKWKLTFIYIFVTNFMEILLQFALI